LEARLGEPRAVLGEDVVDFLAWAWHYRHPLDLTDAADRKPRRSTNYPTPPPKLSTH
jgi:hypothetical protein